MCQFCNNPFFWAFKQMWDQKQFGIRQVCLNVIFIFLNPKCLFVFVFAMIIYVKTFLDSDCSFILNSDKTSIIGVNSSHELKLRQL